MHDTDAPLEHPSTPADLLVLAALLRVMVSADGKLSERELTHADDLPRRLGLGPDEWRAIWDRAARELPNAAAVREAAASLRADVRDAVYELLYRLAESDGLSDPEWDLLEWLDQRWLTQ